MLRDLAAELGSSRPAPSDRLTVCFAPGPESWGRYTLSVRSRDEHLELPPPLFPNRRIGGLVYRHTGRDWDEPRHDLTPAGDVDRLAVLLYLSHHRARPLLELAEADAPLPRFMRPNLRVTVTLRNHIDTPD